MSQETLSTRTPDTPTQPANLRLGAAIGGQLFLRMASSAGLLVIGSYLTDLHDRGENVTSLLVGVVTALVYVTELSFAPIAGALSDQHGRKRFLIAGPALATLAVLLPPLGSLFAALPPLALIVALLSLARLIEGLGSAMCAPATLGFLSEATDHRPHLRSREMSFFELAASGGIALGAVLGPLLWARLHIAAFLVLSLTYLLAALLVSLVREGPRTVGQPQGAFAWRRYLSILSDRQLSLFIPAWIAAAAVVGVWVTAQIEFILTANLHIAGQQFVGSLHGDSKGLSLLLGAYVLWFAASVVAWAFVLGRLPKLPVLLVTVLGTVLACTGLIALNHGGAPILFVPVVLVGVFLEAGFTPAALAYLADRSQAFASDRGRLMGLYSVILGAGQLLGNALGGLFAQWAYFDGLIYLTFMLAAIGMASLSALLLSQRRERSMGV